MRPPEGNYDGQAQSAGPIARSPEIASDKPAANRKRVQCHDREVKNSRIEKGAHSAASVNREA